MNSIPPLLFFTGADYGQANVILATSYELALAGVNVCIVSFAPLETRIVRLQELIARHASRHSTGTPPGSVSFRECKGIITYMDALAKHGITPMNIPHSQGISAALKCYSVAATTVFPWNPDDHLAAIESIKEMIALIKPSMVVAEPFFMPAIDACRLVDQKFTILCPNSVKEIVGHLQPRLAILWKYPALASGFRFPLQWWQIPINIFLYIHFVIQLSSMANAKQVLSLRKSLGIKSMTGFELYPGVTYLCPSLPEIDYPFEMIPGQVLLCGPIIMPSDPLEESNPSLMKWLNNTPTVLVNLGSHVTSDRKIAREMASAFRILLDYHARKTGSRIQVLWKVKAGQDIQKEIKDVIGKEMEEEKVKVVAWLDVEPVSILQHPNVICTVHHGGANSFYEGIWSGMPHVVLPVWFDTYGYADRIEYLNIGIFGNKSCAPGIRAEELGDALVRVSGDTEEARQMKSAAKRLKEVCRAKGDGRKLSSTAILKEVGQ